MNSYLKLYIMLIFLSSTLIAQDIIKDNPEKTKIHEIEKTDTPEAVGDKVIIKDGTTSLIEIENEGSAGSIILPDVGGTLTGSKLYNNGDTGPGRNFTI